MKKQVILFIHGEQVYEGMDPEKVELITEGGMEISEDGVIRLWYEESELTGMEGTTTHFTIGQESVVLERRGMVSSRMEFRLDGRRTTSLYETPWGTMTVAVAAQRLALRINEHGGVMEIRFTIAVDQQLAGENFIKIRVKEMTR